MLVCLSSILIISDELKVEASGGGYEPYIDYNWVKDKIVELADIVSYEDKGRDFGEPGEQEAADDIFEWMQEIDLSNIQQEEIDSHWPLHLLRWYDDPFVGLLDMKREQENTQEETQYYIIVTINRNGEQETRNLICFPWTKSGLLPCQHNVYEPDLKVVSKFKEEDPCDQILFVNNSWAPDPWAKVKEILEGENWHRWKNRYKKGAILADCFDDTYFMGPSWYDHLGTLGTWPRAGFSIRGSDGDWIKTALEEEYEVTAEILSEWEYEEVDSSNVFGQIDGDGTSDKVVIVCAHYDCWWNQGAIDEAAETALVFGIAKYIKELDIEPKYTLKFIAFAGEELGFRGAKDYVKKHNLPIINPEEEVKYVINPGNFGHENRYWEDDDNNKHYIPFNFSSDLPELGNLASDIACALDYTDVTNGIKYGPDDQVGGEDSMVFLKMGCADGIIQFSRWPYEGYHRDDGDQHVKGDVVDIIDDGVLPIECDVVLLTTLQLCFENNHQFRSCTFTPFDSCGDGMNDSVNISFQLTTDIPSLGKVKGLLYKDNEPVSSTASETELLLLDKDEATTGYLTLTLPSDQPEGYYEIRLELKDYDDNVDDECSETVYLNPYGKSIADFSWQPGLFNKKRIYFFDESIASPNATIQSWNWSFGDGTYSEVQNPIHLYDDTGSYIVNLTVWDSNGFSANVSKTLAVSTCVPYALFNVQSNVMCVVDSIQFTSTSYDNDGDIVNTAWDFGDGNLAYGAETEHTYSKSGFYTVTLTVTDDDNATNTTTQAMVIADALVDDSWEENPETHRWDTIQGGIEDVQNDEIVYVFNGTYSEDITIVKSVSLFGEDRENVIITSDGMAENIKVNICSESVYMDGFTIRNGATGIQLAGSRDSTIRNCNVSDSMMGIKIVDGAENQVTHCNLLNNIYGVFISRSAFNWIGSQPPQQQPVVDNCMFQLNRYSIYLENADNNSIKGCTVDATPRIFPDAKTLTSGIYFDESDDNAIGYCDVFNASSHGIYLDDSSGNNIVHCLVRKNNKGVYLSSSSDNLLVGNNFSDNSHSGVAILQAWSSDNCIYYNDFTFNGDDLLYPQAWDEGSENKWNNSENGILLYLGSVEGNYWNDYTSDDRDDDGRGDTPYPIYGGRTVSYDEYPMMEAYDWLRKD